MSPWWSSFFYFTDRLPSLICGSGSSSYSCSHRLSCPVPTFSNIIHSSGFVYSQARGRHVVRVTESTTTHFSTPFLARAFPRDAGVPNTLCPATGVSLCCRELPRQAGLLRNENEANCLALHEEHHRSRL